MSIYDITDRVTQLRVQLGLQVPASSGSGGADFASALADATGTSTVDTNGASGTDVVADARKYLGVPYVFGSNDPAKGLDCSGLVQRVYADLGVKLPRIAADQAKVGQPVAGLAQARPGDLLAFNSPVDHIAIYVGNNQMIAAPQPGEVVKVQKVYQTPSAIRRVLPDASTAVLPALRPVALQGSRPAGAAQYSSLFDAATAKYGLPAGLLAGVAKVESGYNPRAVSPAGAQGLMQIMPGTAKGLGVNPFDPAQAIDGAARLLSGNLKEFGSLPLAVAAYNAGGGAVHKYGGIPPYAETQAYVPKVLAAMAAVNGGANR